MLTIHSGINQNLRPVFEGRKDKNRRQEETKNMSEVDRLRKEYENDEERSLWEKQSQGFEEMLSKNEEKIPKQMKTAMRGGAVLAAGVLGGMATGWSAKYIIAAFKDMSKSRVVQNIAEKFNKNISEPIKKGVENLKSFVSKKYAAFKQTKTFQNNKAKLDKKLDKFNNLSFVQSVKSFGQKVADNKIVRKITGGIDSVLSFIAEGVVKAYNKIAGINYKNAAVGTVSVAGGVSTGAVEAMDMQRENTRFVEGEE